MRACFFCSSFFCVRTQAIVGASAAAKRITTVGSDRTLCATARLADHIIPLVLVNCVRGVLNVLTVGYYCGGGVSRQTARHHSRTQARIWWRI